MQPRRCQVTVCLQTVHTHRASVHQAAKSVTALLRVARVTAGLAESNGRLPPGLWLKSPAGWLPRTRISSRTLRSVIKYGLPLPFLLVDGICRNTMSCVTQWEAHRGWTSTCMSRACQSVTWPDCSVLLCSDSRTFIPLYSQLCGLIAQCITLDGGSVV